MVNKDYNKLYEVIVPETGEIRTYEQIAIEYIKNTYPEEQKKQDNKKKYLELMKSKDNFNKTLQMNYGTFFFNYYHNIIDKEHLFRFMFLCTYMDYDNIIVYGKAKGIHKRANKKDLQEILGLSNKQFYTTINYLTDNELLAIKEDKIVINDKICSRGKIRESNKGAIRMFDEAIKELYEKATSKEHNKLGLFVKMLPLIHHKSNVVCHNADVEDVNDVNPYNLTELAKELGYSTPQRLKRGLMELKINDESLMMVSYINYKSMIVVNPRLYYRGDNIDELMGIINLFKIADKK